MILGKARQQRRNDDRAIIVHHAEANDRLGLARAQGVDRFRMKGKDTLGIGAQLFARGGLHDAVPIALKQLCAEPLLEAPDLHAHRRLCAVEPIGRARERAMLGDGEKSPQQIGIEVGRGHDGTLSQHDGNSILSFDTARMLFVSAFVREQS